LETLKRRGQSRSGKKTIVSSDAFRVGPKGKKEKATGVRKGRQGKTRGIGEASTMNRKKKVPEREEQTSTLRTGTD